MNDFFLLFQTGEHGRLGWLPTDSIINAGFPGEETTDEAQALNNIPVIELFRIILPPAYKTVFFYRCFVTYTVYFKTPIDVPPEWTFTSGNSTVTLQKGYFDRFIYNMGTAAMMPTNNTKPVYSGKPDKPNDGEEDQT